MICAPNVANDLTQPPPLVSQQLITVVAPSARSTYASARTWKRIEGCWSSAGGPYTARVGKKGIRANKREGDGATPAGTFAIAPTMYGNSPNPGVSSRYVRLRCGDWWVEDPRSPAYNSFQRVGCGRAPPFKVVSPDLSESPRAYAHLAVVEYNMDPVVPGRGSGIFLHVERKPRTNGCVSIPYARLVSTLRWLDPTKRPLIAIGTVQTFRRL